MRTQQSAAWDKAMAACARETFLKDRTEVNSESVLVLMTFEEFLRLQEEAEDRQLTMTDWARKKLLCF